MTYQPFHPNFSPLPASSLSNSGLGDPSHVSDHSFSHSRYHANHSYDGHSAPNTLNQQQPLSDGQLSSQQPARGLQYTPAPSQFRHINIQPPGSSAGPNESLRPPLNQTQNVSLNQSSIGHTSPSTRPPDHSQGLDIDPTVSPNRSSDRGHSNATSVSSGDRGHPASSNGSQQGDQDPTSTSPSTVSSILSGELQRLESLLQIQLTPQLSQTIQQLAHLPPHLLSVAGLMIALSRPTANLEQSQQLSQPNHIQPFEFGNAIRNYLRTKTRAIFLRGDLESYVRTQTTKRKHIKKNPVALISEAIEKEGSEFIKTHLPPGYASGEDESISSVFELIKDTLRYERHHLSILMLAGIVEAPANYRYLPETAPTLTQLILLVHRNFMPSLENRSDESIIADLPDTTAVRFTYLRFQLARHRFQGNGQNRRITNWEMIDRDLETLRSKSSGYQVAHTQLIAEKERKLWGRRIGEFEASDFEMPTVAEINHRIAESARND